MVQLRAFFSADLSLRKKSLSLQLLLNCVVGLTKPALAHYPHTCWDTCPALLAPLALFACKVLLNTVQKAMCLKEVSHLQSASRLSYKVPGWSSQIGHVKNPLEMKVA